MQNFLLQFQLISALVGKAHTACNFAFVFAVCDRVSDAQRKVRLFYYYVHSLYTLTSDERPLQRLPMNRGTYVVQSILPNTEACKIINTHHVSNSRWCILKMVQIQDGATSKWRKFKMAQMFTFDMQLPDMGWTRVSDRVGSRI